MFRYAALRLSLLVVVGILLFLAGMRGILLALTTIILASLIAYVFFGKEREKVVARMKAFRERDEQPRVPDADMLIEDAAVDEALAEETGSAEDTGSAEETGSAQEPGGEKNDPDPELN